MTPFAKIIAGILAASVFVGAAGVLLLGVAGYRQYSEQSAANAKNEAAKEKAEKLAAEMDAAKKAFEKKRLDAEIKRILDEDDRERQAQKQD